MTCITFYGKNALALWWHSSRVHTVIQSQTKEVLFVSLKQVVTINLANFIIGFLQNFGYFWISVAIEIVI